MAPTEIPRYRFGPVERRGIIGGLRKSTGRPARRRARGGSHRLRIAPNGPNALLALAALAIAALVAFVPIQGAVA